MSRVNIAVWTSHFYLPVGNTTKSGGKRRYVFGNHTGVRNQYHVAFQQLFMFLNERTKTGRAHFFFAFEDEFDVMFQQVVLHNILECLSLDERLALVVVGSTCPNASVAHLSLEWFAFPKLERFCGHNVVVTVDKHRFGIGIYHLFAVNHRVSIRRHHLGTVYSGHQQQLFPPFGATLHVGFVRLLRANTGYADKAEKLIEHTFFVLLNILLNHLISYLGIILPRLRFVLQAVFLGLA